MDWNEFMLSLEQSSPPDGMSDLLKSMWFARKGDWNRAHDIAQDIHTQEGSRVHAYLHRVEGDIWNADYWYRRANTTRPEISLDKEWEVITREYLR